MAMAMSKAKVLLGPLKMKMEAAGFPSSWLRGRGSAVPFVRQFTNKRQQQAEMRRVRKRWSLTGIPDLFNGEIAENSEPRPQKLQRCHVVLLDITQAERDDEDAHLQFYRRFLQTRFSREVDVSKKKCHHDGGRTAMLTQDEAVYLLGLEEVYACPSTVPGREFELS